MLKPYQLRQQVDLLWLRDSKLGRSDSIYRKTFAVDEADRLRREDYAAGVGLGLAVARPVADVIRQYKKRKHGQVIDVGMFRIGYERGRFLDDAVTRGYCLIPIDIKNPTELANHAQDHFLYNPFSIGDTITSALGQYVVEDVNHASIQWGHDRRAAGRAILLRPAWVQLAQQVALTHAVGLGTNQPQIYTQPTGNLIRTRQYVDGYLLGLNNLPALEIIPAGEELLRDPVKPRLR